METKSSLDALKEQIGTLEDWRSNLKPGDKVSVKQQIWYGPELKKFTLYGEWEVEKVNPLRKTVIVRAGHKVEEVDMHLVGPVNDVTSGTVRSFMTRVHTYQALETLLHGDEMHEPLDPFNLPSNKVYYICEILYELLEVTSLDC